MSSPVYNKGCLDTIYASCFHRLGLYTIVSVGHKYVSLLLSSSHKHVVVCFHSAILVYMSCLHQFSEWFGKCGK